MTFEHPKAFVSTGDLPPPERVRMLVDDAYERFASIDDGRPSQVYPALAQASPELFGICVVGARGGVYGVGDDDVEFTIMSVAKPFVFALICAALGPEDVRRRIGLNATGLPFNSLTAIEQGDEGRTNPAEESSPSPPAKVGLRPSRLHSTRRETACADNLPHGSSRARSGSTSSCHGPKIAKPTPDVARSAKPAAVPDRACP